MNRKEIDNTEKGSNTNKQKKKRKKMHKITDGDQGNGDSLYRM